MELKLIDFTGKFLEEYMKWCVAHPELAEDEEKADEAYFRQYEQWMDTEQDWLGGKTPRNYFKGVKDPRLNVSALIEYVREDMDIPEPLVDALVERGEEVYPILMGILMGDNLALQDLTDECLSDIRSHAVRLIGEMGAPHPYPRYIELLKGEEDSLLGDALTDALVEAVNSLREELLAAYHSSEGAARQAFLDVLSYSDEDERVGDVLTLELSLSGANLAFLAVCAGRYGDASLLPALYEAARREEIEYFEYKELMNAVEELGGEPDLERDFSGDPFYEYLKGQDESNL